MRIVCPTCQTGYEIKAEALGPNGRTVRCASCSSTWFAFPDAPAETAAEILQPENAEVRTETTSEPPVTINPESEAEHATESSGPRLVRSVESGVRRRRTNKRASAKAPREGASPLASGLVVLGVLVACMAGAVYFREAVVRTVPDMAGLFAAIGLPVNLRGLEFRDITASIEFEAGQPVTVVEGRIENVTDVSLAVPRLRLAVRGGDGREVMSWAASATRPVVGPRESVPFRTRLTASVRDGSDIEVRFLAQRDARAGAIR